MIIDPDVTEAEHAELARLVAALPSDLDEGGHALHELRNTWGVQAGHIWPTARRLELAVRVVGDRRRRAVPGRAGRPWSGAR